MNPIYRLWDFVFAGSESTLNNALRALVYGVIVAYFVYDFFTYKVFEYGLFRQTIYGTKEAILAFIVVSGLLFVRYNTKKQKGT